MSFIPQYVAATRIDKARKAMARGIKYRLGHGGTDPDDDLPTKTMYCDCTGFAAWTMGLNRAPKKERPFWIESTNIVNDANSNRKAFTRLQKPEPGAYVVYPDRKTWKGKSEGHIGLVTEVFKNGRYSVIDCSSSQGGKEKEAIREWDRTDLFKKNGAIFVTLKQDIHRDGQMKAA